MMLRVEHGVPVGSHRSQLQVPKPPPAEESCINFSASLYVQPQPQAGQASRSKLGRPGSPMSLRPGAGQWLR